MTTQYLDILKESTFNSYPGVRSYSLDFGNEIMEDILIQEGIFLDASVLTEGIFDVPMNKLKSMAGDVTAKISSPEGLEQIVAKYGKMTSAFSISDIKRKAVNFAETKGIEEKQVLSAFEKVLRSFAAVGFASGVLFNPLGWVIIIVCLIKSGSFSQFSSNIGQACDEIIKGIETGKGKFSSALDMGSLAWKFFLISLIPPWIQVVITMPVMGVLCFVAFIMFAFELLKLSKRRDDF